MKQGALTHITVSLLLNDGHSCYRPRRTGERKLKSTHLEQKVGDALVATAGGQHQWSLPFWGRHIHTHPCLEQQVDNGIVSNRSV
ncbi:hypothetical protein A6R68_04418 [Neotoma lepida]|uniref:Small ribosomal subunit protein eS6 n=1 Tax=Neotoma lepida TaxID=56216 RepID=A0A1A6GLH8_NEOLE|nr:hypothetical protein A6R68_04418 [Neotoma lepida]